MDKQKALENLKDFTNVLDKYNARYFLTFGTCLGALREGDFIGHDKDMDVGILSDDFHFQMLADFVEAGFEILFIFGMRFKGYEIAFKRNDIKIDLMLYYIEKDFAWNALWLNGGRNGMKDIIKLKYPKYLFTYTQPRMLNIQDYPFPVVYDVEDYVRCIYGDEWQTPDPKWRWWESPHNIDNDLEI